MLSQSDALVGSICALCAAHAPAGSAGGGAERGQADGLAAAARRVGGGKGGAPQEAEEVLALTVALQTMSVWMAGRRCVRALPLPPPPSMRWTSSSEARTEKAPPISSAVAHALIIEVHDQQGGGLA